MRAEFGYCIVCDKEIAKVCPTCHHKGTTGDYTEIQVKWSNGSLMNMAVCTICAAKAFTEDEKKAMTQAHFAAWDKLGGKYDKEIVIV